MKFNRALLLNVGYVEALKDFPHWDCFIFHDVDHLPEDDRNLYQGPFLPCPHFVGNVILLQYMYNSFNNTS